MMKFFVLVIFMMGLVFFTSMIMFYSNMCCLVGGIMIMTYSIMWAEGGGWLLMSGYFSFDKYSVFMIMLSAWIVGLMFVTLYSGIDLEGTLILKKVFFLVLLNVLIMFFSSFNFLGLYFLFEVSLIPTYFLVFYWGGNYERLEISFYLLIYMMFISFPLLVYIMKMYGCNYSLDIYLMGVLSLNKFMTLMGSWGYLVVFGAFFIKLPVFLFHGWLPKAHVEAPVYGSMLLAAILLKLGGYSLLRLIFMFGEGCVVYSCYVISVGMTWAVYSSILCLTQVDMKSLVAYSSVVHMNFMLASLFSMVKLGFVGGFMGMVSHGLCSSGLFYMVNIFYSHSLSRLLILNKGLISVSSSLMFWWFLLCASNFSFPFSLNFIAEVIMIMTLLGWDFSMMGLLSVMCFFSGTYSLYMFSLVLHGPGGLWGSNNGGLLVEHLASFMHYSPLLLIMFNLYMFV